MPMALVSSKPVWKKSFGSYDEGLASFSPQLIDGELRSVPYVFWNFGMTNGEEKVVLFE